MADKASALNPCNSSIGWLTGEENGIGEHQYGGVWSYFSRHIRQVCCEVVSKPRRPMRTSCQPSVEPRLTVRLELL